MSDDDFAASLVRAGKRERMPEAQKHALLASLGTSVALGGALGATKLAAPAKSIGSALFAKWLAVGVATTALAIGTVKGADHFLATPPPVVVSSVTPVAPVAPVALPAPVESLTAPGPALLPTVAPLTIASAPRAVASAMPIATSTATPVRSVADEARVVERARTALAQGETAAASAALDEHDRAYPGGAFADEARVVRIDLLARSDRAAAQRAATDFLADHPASPYATHLRQLSGSK